MEAGSAAAAGLKNCAEATRKKLTNARKRASRRFRASTIVGKRALIVANVKVEFRPQQARPWAPALLPRHAV